MRKLWSNSRERTRGYEKRQDEDSSYSKGIEVLLRETTKKNYPNTEDVDNPMIAPQDYDVRQSERVLEFQNRDFWIRPTDLSLHFPIFVTIREICQVQLYRNGFAGVGGEQPHPSCTHIVLMSSFTCYSFSLFCFQARSLIQFAVWTILSMHCCADRASEPSRHPGCHSLSSCPCDSDRSTSRLR